MFGTIHLLVLLAVLGVEPGPAPTGDSGRVVAGAAGNTLRTIIAAGEMPELRWPNFSDYVGHVKKFYASDGYAPAWLRDGEPTRQATTVIDVLRRADSKGLNAEDYDGPRWADRLTRLQASPSSDEQERFDAALTVCVMRYVSDLRIGKVNPRRLNISLDVGPKKYDLAAFLREKVIDGADVQRALDDAEPPFGGYRRTQEALQRYRELSREDSGEQLPVPAKPVVPGDIYAGLARLARLLRLVGDLSADATPDTSGVYAEPLVGAVKRFQGRHGLAPDGRLGAQTVKELNTPLSARVEQLRLTLERWRWIPYEFPRPPIVVNIPEFRLRAFDSAERVAFASNVIVGKAYRNQTPVFERDMTFVVLRPYWNVPTSILRSEILPAIRRDRNYVAKKGYEVTTHQGAVVTSGAISDEVLQQLASGRLTVRQKPGAANALGLVKLMFPNEYNVYLHSTPSQALFSQSRRDFSHGCIRVERAAELTAFVLKDKLGWDLDRVRTAMQNGQDDLRVTLSEPFPVLILYGTAVVDEEGDVHFFDDIYGHDATLQKVLSRGYPYPG